MALEKEELLRRLNKACPDGFIYRDAYYTGAFSEAIVKSVHTYAGIEGLSDIAWLESNGFIWRETGYCEPDMRPYSFKWRTGSVSDLAESILYQYPLIGQYEISKEEFSALYSAAAKYLLKACRKGATLTFTEQAVLTVATVFIIKNRELAQSEDSGSDTFWQYIYQQYGFSSDNPYVTNQRLYKCFCVAISETLDRYRRYFAPQGTMRYYTSVLLHAIAPRASIESLLDILFDFYVKNLDYQYIPDDSSYKTLVRGMQARWTENSSDIRLKSSVVMSGLKTLFLQRPFYMASVCENLVKKIDALLRGEEVEVQDRWDQLLTDWYKKKSSAERTKLQGEKRSRRTEFVATTADRIYIQYEMENGKVGLKVPQIRLTEIGEERPVLALYQGRKEIFRSVLSVTGNDLGLTTRRLFVPLEETEIDFSEKLDLCGEIEYLGETLYSSGSKLYRTAVCFDQNGNERNVKTGAMYLFSDADRDIDFADEDGVTMENHAGQLYRVNLDAVGAVYVEGEELFADEKTAGKARLSTSIRPIRGIELCSEGTRYHVFSSPFSLQLHLSKSENPLRYQLRLDGERIFPEEEGEDTQVFQLSELTGDRHRVSLVDIVQSVTILEYPFILIPDFSWALDKPRYLETEDTAELMITDRGKELKAQAYRLPGSDLAATLANSNGISYEVELPTVHCSFGGQSAFSLPDRIWYNTVGKDVFSKLQLPPMWQGRLMMGITEIAPNSDGQYEIGNLIHSGRSLGPDAMLWLSLQSPEGKKEQILLTTLYFQPTFTEPPLRFADNELWWAPGGSFIGEPGSHFHLVLSGPAEYGVDSLTDEDNRLYRIQHGRYSYEVTIKNEGIFAAKKGKPVFQGDIIIGDVNEFRFENAELHLSKAIYWDYEIDRMINMELGYGKGILEDLEYLGIDSPSWETTPMPKYRAMLCFENGKRWRVPFNADPNKDEYLLINPVTLWIVNDSLLILTTVEEEVIYIDSSRRSIPNRNPRKANVSMGVARMTFQNPDYFEYVIRRKDDV